MSDSERDRRDLDAAAAASGMSVTRVEIRANGDGTSQALAIGPDPTASPRAVAALFVLGGLSAVGFAVAYAAGADHVVLGVLAGGALLAMGIGLIAWGKHLLPETLSVETRPDLDQGGDDELAEDLARPELAQPGRRLLIGSLAGAAGAFAVAIAFPLRGLGPQPGNALATTSWKAGLRLVRRDGSPVHRDGIALDGSLTVFPDGHAGDGDAQVVLLRVPAELLSSSTSAGGVVDGRVAYSKVCTHAGCPVAQFRVDSRRPDPSYELLCPCHQSLFDVLDGARVLAGPAATPLPQLPIDVDAEGYLIATGDFARPIGPSYWNEP